MGRTHKGRRYWREQAWHAGNSRDHAQAEADMLRDKLYRATLHPMQLNQIIREYPPKVALFVGPDGDAQLVARDAARGWAMAQQALDEKRAAIYGTPQFKPSNPVGPSNGAGTCRAIRGWRDVFHETATVAALAGSTALVWALMDSPGRRIDGNAGSQSVTSVVPSAVGALRVAARTVAVLAPVLVSVSVHTVSSREQCHCGDHCTPSASSRVRERRSAARDTPSETTDTNPAKTDTHITRDTIAGVL